MVRHPRQLKLFYPPRRLLRPTRKGRRRAEQGRKGAIGPKACCRAEGGPGLKKGDLVQCQSVEQKYWNPGRALLTM